MKWFRILTMVRQYWMLILYGVIALAFNILIIYGVYRIVYRDFHNSVITLRFNIYEGVTVIENSTQILGYLGLSLGITFTNVVIITILYRRRILDDAIRSVVTHWIGITTIMALVLVGYYLMLVMEINA